VVQDVKAARKPYRAPAFEVLVPSAAQAKLATVEASKDGSAQEMLSVSNKQLEKQTSIAQSATLSLSPQ
jgi:hypothetical protein